MKEVPKKDVHVVSGGAIAPVRVIDSVVTPIDPTPGPTYPQSPFPPPLTHPEK